MIAENRLLEWAEVYGNYYGTPADKVREVLESGKDVLLEIDTQGALNVQKMFLKEGTFIFYYLLLLQNLKNAFADVALKLKKQ